MARLHKNIQKYSPHERIAKKVVGKKTYDQVHPLGTAMVKMDDQAKAAEQAVRDAGNERAIPLPDEEELERQRRRRSRRGGRASTVLTEDDRLGP